MAVFVDGEMMAMIGDQGPMNTVKIAANTRISAKIASEIGNHTAVMSLFYHN